MNLDGSRKDDFLAITPQDSCSWLIEAECGSPGFLIDETVTNMNDNDVEIHYVEYTKSEFNNMKLDQN